MKTIRFIVLVLLVSMTSSLGYAQQELYNLPEKGVHTRWTSPENPDGKKGAGARENKGAKGHAFDTIKAHGHYDLLNVKGSGIVRRIKLTVDDRSPEMLRSLRVEMYWDGVDKPAVSVPLGDFFGVAFGATASYETALFANPEGRSFVATIPMAYKKGARITVYNDSDKNLGHIFYDVEFEKWKKAPKNMAYFHAYWHRNTPELGKDFNILPKVKGKGKFIGTNIGVQADTVYGDQWFGEGEVKVFLDGDKQHPTLVGTGVEDYIGTAWGQGKFNHLYEGSLIADDDNLRWAFYRYHIKDPIYFHKDIQVNIQQIGGGPLKEVRKLEAKDAPIIPISVDAPGHFYKLKEMTDPPKLEDDDFPKGWTNYYRQDDWSATAYFYLDKPTDNLPAIAPVEDRIRDLRGREE